MDKYWIILDIETTGFSHQKNEITEIGAIKINKNTLEIIDELCVLINIDGDVPIFIEKLTGISKNLLNNKGISINKALTMLSQFCYDAPILAHYAAFDKRFIQHNLLHKNISYNKSEWIDTIDIFKKKWPNRTTYKLNSLIIDHKLANKEEHRALSDARHTLQLLKICL